GGGQAAAGLRWASLGMALQAGFCAFLGIKLLPDYVKRLGPNKAMKTTLLSQGLLQLSFIIPSMFSSWYIAKLLVLLQLTALGAPWGLVHTAPYVLVGQRGDPSQNGRLQGQLNTYVVGARGLGPAARPAACHGDDPAAGGGAAGRAPAPVPAPARRALRPGRPPPARPCPG
ncbi:unnamed protein product, partial [Heterosigma akashiwo]